MQLQMQIELVLSVGRRACSPGCSGRAGPPTRCFRREWCATGLALAHGQDTPFGCTAGIFASGAVIGGALLRRGPLYARTVRTCRTPGS